MESENQFDHFWVKVVKLVFTFPLNLIYQPCDYFQKTMKPVVVNVKKLPSTLMVTLPRLPRKSQAQQLEEAALQLESDLGDQGDRNGYIYQCPEKGGLGIKSTRALGQGEFFMEYSGDTLSKEEALQRDKEYGDQGKGCFLLYFKHRGENLAVDATLSSRKGRFINHNKHGNLRLKVALDAKKQPRVLLVTTRKVGAGEAMEYAYGEHDPETLAELKWLK